MGRNRIQAKTPKLGKGYCSCDKAIVAIGSKCPECKTRMGKKRLKK